jgi:hypothetical protein
VTQRFTWTDRQSPIPYTYTLIHIPPKHHHNGKLAYTLGRDIADHIGRRRMSINKRQWIRLIDRANTHSQKKSGVHREDGGLDLQTGVATL